MSISKVVTSGIASEYVLSEFASFLRGKGIEVIQLDFASVTTDPIPILRSLAGECVTYITSAHLSITRRLASIIAPHLTQLYPYYLCPIEIIPILRPRKAVYAPHDLLAPFGEESCDEYRYLDMFDGILTPYELDFRQGLLPSRCRVLNAGWIKFNDQSKAFPLNSSTPVINGNRTSFCMSFVQHFRGKYGIEGTIEYYRPIFELPVVVKLPAWKGIEDLEQAIESSTPSQIVPSSVNSIELIMSSDIVLSNGASSTLAEACLMGKKSICLQDSETEDLELTRHKLKKFDSILFHDYSQRQSPIELLLPKLDPCVLRQPQFDFQRVFDFICSL